MAGWGKRRSTVAALMNSSVRHLTDSILACPAQLKLSYNQIGAAGAVELAKALAVNRRLTSVCNARHAG